MISSIKKLKYLLFSGNKRVLQIGTLYTAMMMAVVIGLITSIINTRTLEAEGYGNYKFINNYFLFLVTISSLGLFNTGSQNIAKLRSDDVKKYDVFGALVFIALIITCILIFTSIIFSFVESKIFNNNLGGIISIFSPIVGIIIFQSCIENILQGDNKIVELSLFRLLPPFLFMILLFLSNIIFKLSLVATLLIQFVSGAVIILLFLKKIKSKYNNLAENRKLIWDANKSYGRYIYIGVLAGVATSYISTFMISYFLDNTKVGFFSLALTITLPLSQISSVVGTTYFKDFAHSDALPTKVTVITAGIAVVTLCIFLLVIKDLVSIIYTKEFSGVASLAGITAIGSVFHGMGDYFNRFLGAHARGKQMRNGAIAVGIVNVLGYIFLVKFFGVEGAAITKLLSGITYCALMVFYYIEFRKEKLNLLNIKIGNTI